MTLFKKVFQNQATPASQEEEPSSEALARGEDDVRVDPFAPDLEDESNSAERDEVPVIAECQEPTSAPEPAGDAFLSVDPDAAADAAPQGGFSENLPSLSAPAPEDLPDWAAVTATGTHEAPDPESTQPREPSCTDVDSEIESLLGRMDEARPSDAPHALESTEKPGIVPPEATEPDETPERGRLADPDEIVAFAQAQLRSMEAGPAATAGEITDATPQADAGAIAAAPLDLSGDATLEAVPSPAAGRAGRRAGRVKTRLLGFNRADRAESDPFDATQATAAQQREKFPVGWLVIVEGPGRGHSFSLFNGASVIGRGEDQFIRLDFGDNAISRSNHAAIAYDDEQNKFYIGHGGKSNIIRRNARPVLSTEELNHADLIRIGETTLRFVALCGSDFKWDTTEGCDAADL